MILRRHRRRHHTLSYVVLSGLAFGIAAPLVVGSRLDRLAFSNAAAMNAVRDSFTLGAPLPLVASAGILLERGRVSVAKSQASSTRTVDDLITLLASGNARLVLDNSELVFSSATAVAEVPPPIDAATPLIATLLGSHFESLRINHGVVSVMRAGGGGISLADVNADISMRRKGVVSGRGTFVYRGKTLRFDVTIGLGDRQSAQRLPIDAHIGGDLIKISLDGRITLGSGLQMSASAPRLETPNLRALAAWLGYDWPTQVGFEQFKAQGNFDLADNSVSLQQATLSLDGNEATGSVFLNLHRRGQPTIDATLAMHKLDLAPYLRQPARPSDAPTLPWLALVRAFGLDGLPILSGLDADLRISAERVALGSTTLGRGAATVTAKGGRVIADVAELELDSGGSATLQLSHDASRQPARYKLSGQLKQLDAATLLPQPSSGIGLLEGGGTLTADLSAAGASSEDILASLGGKVALDLPQGGRIGLDLPALIAMAQAKAPVSGWQAAGASSTKLDHLLARFRIADGVWTIDEARARSGNAVYVGEGAVRPTTRSLDVTVTRGNGLAAAEAAATGAAPGPGSVGSATQSVLVKGPWSVPQILPTAPRAIAPVGKPVAPAASPGARKPSPGGRG